MKRKPPRPKISSGVRELARQPPGLVFVTDVECINCFHEWKAVYYHPPEVFQCPSCRRMKGFRVDANHDFMMEMLGKDDDEVEF
jgi:ribosomal protein S27E